MILASLVLAASAPAAGHIPKTLVLKGKFERVGSMNSIPEPVRSAFLESLEARKSYGVADSTATWSAGCTVTPDNPLYKLAYAASIPPYWIIAFEHGGYASGEGLYVFRVAGDKVDGAWSDLRLPRGEGIQHFIARLEKGDICFVSPPRLFFYAEELKECVPHGT